MYIIHLFYVAYSSKYKLSSCTIDTTIVNNRTPDNFIISQANPDYITTKNHPKNIFKIEKPYGECDVDIDKLDSFFYIYLKNIYTGQYNLNNKITIYPCY